MTTVDNDVRYTFAISKAPEDDEPWNVKYMYLIKYRGWSYQSDLAYFGALWFDGGLISQKSNKEEPVDGTSINNFCKYPNSHPRGNKLLLPVVSQVYDISTVIFDSDKFVFSVEAGGGGGGKGGY